MLVTAAAATMLAGYRHHYIKHFIQEKNSYITKDGFNTLEKLIHKSIRASQTKEKGSTHHKSTHPQIDSYITDRGAGFNTNKITHLQIDSHNIEEGLTQLLRRSGAAPQVWRSSAGSAQVHCSSSPHHRCSAPLSPLQHLETKRGEPRGEACH